MFIFCDKRTQRELKNECLEQLNRNYPKKDDLGWKLKTFEGKWVVCDKPPYTTDMDTATRDITHLEVVK